ncbi:MAG: HsdM family class I SAM-dependent methyltransferase, partial [Acidimicrobiales bacterium]
MVAAQTTSAPRGAPRRLRGDYPTPPQLVRLVVDAVMPAVRPGQRVEVLDPACGDGRFLLAAAELVAAAGGEPVVHGVDVDEAAVARARRLLAGIDAQVECGDTLADGWPGGTYDAVVGNPPFLSQLATVTTRGGASRHGGGPYADAAAEFLALAVQHARPGGGRVGLVLPQSILGSRDAGPLRADVEQHADLIWSWWSPHRQFDAAVLVCALGFERRRLVDAGNRRQPGGDQIAVWTDVIVSALGVPPIPELDSNGTVGDRALLSANFRDEYYGLVPAVGDHAAGPRLVTSRLIDPNRCWWGQRAITFNRHRFARPRVDVTRLDDGMLRWAQRLSVPKLLIANQTKIIECVVDDDATMLPGVPVIAARPHRPGRTELAALAAVVSSPLASAWAWHRAAGTGMSARSIRLRPGLLAGLPWPAGTLGGAAAAWRDGDLAASAEAVHRAYGLDAGDAARLVSWWDSWSTPA